MPRPAYYVVSEQFLGIPIAGQRTRNGNQKKTHSPRPYSSGDPSDGYLLQELPQLIPSARRLFPWSSWLDGQSQFHKRPFHVPGTRKLPKTNASLQIICVRHWGTRLIPLYSGVFSLNQMECADTTGCYVGMSKLKTAYSLENYGSTALLM